MNIKIIGLGGVGSILAGRMARFLNYMNVGSHHHESVNIVLIDGDTYEEKNRQRQEFSEVGGNKAEVKSRIILTPEHAKRLLLALKDNIAKYESINGQIKNVEVKGSPVVPMNFGGPTAQA